MNRHLTLLAMVFFLWGIITSINSAIILFFSQYFSVSWQQAILVTVIFYVAPFAVCLPCARLMARLGYRRVLQGALLLSTTGSLILAQAVVNATFFGALFGMFVIASGVSVLQVVANPYLTALSTPARQIGNLSLASAVNSLGTTLAPAGIALLFRLSPEQQPVSGLFSALAVVTLALMAGTMLLKLPDVRINHVRTPPVASLWRVKEIRLTILAIFLYVGTEVSLAANLPPLPDSHRRLECGHRAVATLLLLGRGAGRASAVWLYRSSLTSCHHLSHRHSERLYIALICRSDEQRRWRDCVTDGGAGELGDLPHDFRPRAEPLARSRESAGWRHGNGRNWRRRAAMGAGLTCRGNQFASEFFTADESVSFADAMGRICDETRKTHPLHIWKG